MMKMVSLFVVLLYIKRSCFDFIFAKSDRLFLIMLENVDPNSVSDDYVKRIKQEIRTRTKRIEEYEKEINRLKEESNSKALNLTMFENSIRNESVSLVENANSYLENTISNQNDLDFQEVNQHMNDLSKNREMDTVIFKEKLLEDKFQKLNEFIDETSNNIRNIQNKKEEIIKILQESQLENENIHDSIDSIDQEELNKRESTEIHLKLYNKMISDLQLKINQQNTVNQNYIDQINEEMQKLKIVKLDTYEKDAYTQRVQEKLSKIDKLDKELAKIEARKSELREIIANKEKEYNAEILKTKKHQKVIDSLNIAICPDYVVNLCKRIAETKQQTVNANEAISVKKFAQREICIELKRLKSYIESVQRKINRESERYLSISLDINKCDAELIHKIANENEKEHDYKLNASEYDKIIQKISYLETEWDELFNYKYKEYKIKSPTKWPNINEINKLQEEIQELECKKSRLSVKTRYFMNHINEMNENINEMKIKTVKLNVKTQSISKPLRNTVNLSNQDLIRKIQQKTQSIELRKARIQQKNDVLTRIEKVHNVHSHKTPFIIIDHERVCDRKNLRYLRVTDAVLNEQRAVSYVETLEDLLFFINTNNCTIDIEKYNLNLDRLISKIYHRK